MKNNQPITTFSVKLCVFCVSVLGKNNIQHRVTKNTVFRRGFFTNTDRNKLYISRIWWKIITKTACRRKDSSFRFASFGMTGIS